MSSDDYDYFARRAEQEAYLAERSTNPAAVAAHYRLSTAYLDRLHPPAADPANSDGAAAG
jgi:hypothetical protein